MDLKILSNTVYTFHNEGYPTQIIVNAKEKIVKVLYDCAEIKPILDKLL